MAQCQEIIIYKTSEQIDDLVLALIDAADDKDTNVQYVVQKSLEDIGKQQAPLLLSSCLHYLVTHGKLAQSHRILILKCMGNVITETLDNIDLPLAVDIITHAANEMTCSKDVQMLWQTSASVVLVNIGRRYCAEVMNEMLNRFTAGSVPHFFVMQTMANLASSNTFAMVPFMRVVLGTSLSMMGLTKQDNMRWVFTYALCKFCEAILEYVANIEKAPDQTISKDSFANEIYSAYDILFNSWINTKTPKLRIMIVETIGQMSQILNHDRLVEQIPKLLQTIIGLYQRHGSEAYHITQGLCNVITGATQDCGTILEPHLEKLFTILFIQVCQPVDYGQPSVVKNHNEILRCFSVLARCHCEKVLHLLLQKLEGNNEKNKLGAITVLRHLVNAANEHMVDKKQLLLTGLNVVLQDPNNKIKKAVAQTIVAMAHHDYLEEEGGRQLVEFILQQCTLQSDNILEKRPSDVEYVSNNALKMMCSNALQLLLTLDNMHIVLWPHMLEYLVQRRYKLAAGALCKCISQIAVVKRDEESPDYMFHFADYPNVPKPPEITARLMVLAGCVSHSENNIECALELLAALSCRIHDNLPTLWDVVLPNLIKQYTDTYNTESWDTKEWQDAILKLLSDTLDEIKSDEWTIALGTHLAQQINLYVKIKHKSFLYKCMGIVLKMVKKRDYVNKQMDFLFADIQNQHDMEREAISVAIGYAGSSHLDDVLAKLDSVLKSDSKKSGGLFSFMKSDSDDSIRSTLILCYGNVVFYANPTLITSRLDTQILKTVVKFLATAKSMEMKSSLMLCIDLMCRALHPTRLQTTYTMSHKAEILKYIQLYMKSEVSSQITSPMRSQSMKAASALVNLSGKLEDIELYDLVHVSLACTIPVSSFEQSQNSKESSYEQHLHQQQLHTQVFDALEALLGDILLTDVSPVCLENIFKHLFIWSLSQHTNERRLAITLIMSLLNLYIEKMEANSGRSFDNVGSLIGRLVARCSDHDEQVRHMAVDCLQTLLKITLIYSGKPRDYKESMIEDLSKVKDTLHKLDADTLYKAMTEIAKALIHHIPADQFQPLIYHILDGLVDPHGDSSYGACVVLNALLKNRAAQLHSQLDDIVVAIVEKVSQISYPKTRTGALHAVRNIMSHHLQPVMNLLLSYTLPWHPHVLECWRINGEDGALLSTLLDQLLDILAKTLPYEERQSNFDKKIITRIATLQPIAVTCAIGELLCVPEARQTVISYFPRLFVAILTRVASSVGVQPPFRTAEKNGKNSGKPLDIHPSILSVEALQRLIQCIDENGEMVAALNDFGVWDSINVSDTYHEAVTLLISVLSQYNPEQLGKIVPIITPVLGSVYDTYRITAAAVMSQLIEERCGGDLELVDVVVNSLLSKLIDPCLLVRMYCIRGLGNIAHTGKQQVERYATTVLSALMSGLEDKEDVDDLMTLASMSGLAAVLAEIEEPHVRAILINITLNIRLGFQKDKVLVRATAFSLFGDLSRFASGPSTAMYLEQIHSNMVALLLHLNDPATEVRKACKKTLRDAAPLMEAESVNAMLQQHLIGEGSLHYVEFINSLTKAIIKDLPDKIDFYISGAITNFKSQWPEIRANSVVLVGCLLGNLPEGTHPGMSKQHISTSMISLLKDPMVDVRIQTAEAISRLHHF